MQSKDITLDELKKAIDTTLHPERNGVLIKRALARAPTLLVAQNPPDERELRAFIIIAFYIEESK